MIDFDRYVLTHHLLFSSPTAMSLAQKHLSAPPDPFESCPARSRSTWGWRSTSQRHWVELSSWSWYNQHPYLPAGNMYYNNGNHHHHYLAVSNMQQLWKSSPSPPGSREHGIIAITSPSPPGSRPHSIIAITSSTPSSRQHGQGVAELDASLLLGLQQPPHCLLLSVVRLR